MPAEGIHFISSSENADLDGDALRDDFRQRGVRPRRGRSGVLGTDPHPYFRVRRGLANEQDLYVVPRGRDCDLDRLAAFRKGAWGWVDECRARKRASSTCGAGPRPSTTGPLEVDRDQDRRHCLPLPDRSPSRRRAHRRANDARLGASGWEFRHRLGAGPPSAFAEVTVRSALDEVALLYAGPLARPSRTNLEPFPSIGKRLAKRVDALLGMIRR